MNVHRPGTHIYFCHNVINSKVLFDSLAKLEAQTGVNIEPVPCSGRIDPRYILKAFLRLKSWTELRRSVRTAWSMFYQRHHVFEETWTKKVQY